MSYTKKDAFDDIAKIISEPEQKDKGESLNDEVVKYRKIKDLVELRNRTSPEG